MSETTVRLTVAQAIVRYLQVQQISRDGQSRRFFAGALGIFGHGNVAGLGEALQQAPEFPYALVRNEQAAVHLAAGYARMCNRLSTYACVSSIGPGATNMITGAAGATINRIPVLLLPGDIFARRNVAPVLQQLESPATQDIGVNDCFKPVSRYWDRIYRPEQILTSLPQAMRVLTSPADTGAVTLALPQDVQSEAYDFPAAFFESHTWYVPRQPADRDALARAAEAIRAAKRPVIVAGGGVINAEATEALARFAEATGIPVGETQAGKGALPYDTPAAWGPSVPRHPGGQCRRSRCRPVSSASAHAIAIHHRLADPLPESRVRLSTSTWPSSTLSSRPPCVGGRCTGDAGGAGRGLADSCAAAFSAEIANLRPPGRPRSSGSTISSTGRCPLRVRSSAPCGPPPAPETCW
jgi:3D-(3,5/4)-trihydroxycyclohexane-1,2-dione acylhydrolase (decyclizing)